MTVLWGTTQEEVYAYAQGQEQGTATSPSGRSLKGSEEAHSIRTQTSLHVWTWQIM